MKQYKLLAATIFFLAAFASTVRAASVFIVQQGGTGANTFNKHGVIYNGDNSTGPLTSNSSFKYSSSGFEVGFTGDPAVIQATPDGNAYLGKTSETNVTVDNTAAEVDIKAYRDTVSSTPTCTTTCTIDDLTLSPSIYTGPSGENFSLTVTYNSGYALAFSGETGGTLTVGDTVTQTDCAGAGTSGQLIQINGGTVLVIASVVPVGGGWDGPGCHLSNGMGVTADEGTVLDSDKDVYDWTSTTGGSGSNIFMVSSPYGLTYGVNIEWGIATSGHDVGSNWSWTYSVLYYSMFQANGITGIAGIGDITGSVNGTKIVVDIPNKETLVSNKFGTSNGVDIASSTNLSLGDDGNYFQVSGTSGIKCIKQGLWRNGMDLTLFFQGALQLNHNDGSCTLDAIPMALEGSGNAMTATGAIYVFHLDTSLGSNGQWKETSRAYP